MSTAIFTIDSRAPIVSRLPLPIGISCIVAEFVIGYFQIEEFSEMNAVRRAALAERISEWPEPIGKSDIEVDYQSTRRDVLEALSETPLSSQVATAIDAVGVQAVVIYTKHQQRWFIRHFLSRRTVDSKNPPQCAGTAVMHRLIDNAYHEGAGYLELAYRTSAIPFYKRFGFYEIPVITMVKAIKWQQSQLPTIAL